VRLTHLLGGRSACCGRSSPSGTGPFSSA